MGLPKRCFGEKEGAQGKPDSTKPKYRLVGQPDTEEVQDDREGALSRHLSASRGGGRLRIAIHFKWVGEVEPLPHMVLGTPVILLALATAVAAVVVR